jgi:hypothetical protein
MTGSRAEGRITRCSSADLAIPDYIISKLAVYVSLQISSMSMVHGEVYLPLGRGTKSHGQMRQRLNFSPGAIVTGCFLYMSVFEIIGLKGCPSELYTTNTFFTKSLSSSKMSV